MIFGEFGGETILNSTNYSYSCRGG